MNEYAAYIAWKFDDETWTTLVEQGIVPGDHHGLINALQLVHDDHEPDQWREQLGRVANDFDLVCDFAIASPFDMQKDFLSTLILSNSG